MPDEKKKKLVKIDDAIVAFPGDMQDSHIATKCSTASVVPRLRHI